MLNEDIKKFCHECSDYKQDVICIECYDYLIDYNSQLKKQIVNYKIELGLLPSNHWEKGGISKPKNNYELE